MSPTFPKIPSTKHIRAWLHQHHSNWFTLDACIAWWTRRLSDSTMSISWSDRCVTVALWTYWHSAEEILHQHHWPEIQLNNDTIASLLDALSAAVPVVTLLCCCLMPKTFPCRLVGMLQDHWSQSFLLGYVWGIFHVVFDYDICVEHEVNPGWTDIYAVVHDVGTQFTKRVPSLDIYLSENINLIGWSSVGLPKTGTMWESVQTSGLSQDRNVWIVRCPHFSVL